LLFALTPLGQAEAAPLPVTPVERALAFSACAGRFSAAAEFAYLIPGIAPDLAEDRRDLFAEMVEAVLPHATRAGLPETLPMSVRVEAKAAHAALLHRATFATDDLAATPARAAADHHLAVCEALILGA